MLQSAAAGSGGAVNWQNREGLSGGSSDSSDRSVPTRHRTSARWETFGLKKVAASLSSDTGLLCTKDLMKDPAAMKSAMAAASAMGQGSGPEARRRSEEERFLGAPLAAEADLMKKMMENPEMMLCRTCTLCHGSCTERPVLPGQPACYLRMDAMTNMMKNIPPEQMQKMMDMSMKLGQHRALPFLTWAYGDSRGGVAACSGR